MEKWARPAVGGRGTAATAPLAEDFPPTCDDQDANVMINTNIGIIII